MVPLTPEDLRVLRAGVDSKESKTQTSSGKQPQTAPTDTEHGPVNKRVISQDMADHQAIQMEVPVNADDWQDLDRSNIRNNYAEEPAVKRKLGDWEPVLGGQREAIASSRPHSAMRLAINEDQRKQSIASLQPEHNKAEASPVSSSLPLSDLHTRCCRAFELLSISFQHQESGSQHVLRGTSKVDAEFDRYKLWARSVGVERLRDDEEQSLDYRLPTSSFFHDRVS